jgi:type VI secretion system protein ImpF
MSERKAEIRMPLFDRLVDLERKEHREELPRRTLGRRDLEESVRFELEQLFNTRCPTPAHRLSGRPCTVVDYGIPDLAGFSARSADDRVRVAEILRRAVEVFEPRLAGVRIVLETVPEDDFALAGRIEAVLVSDPVAEPVSFVTTLELKEGEVEVHAGFG